MPHPNCEPEFLYLYIYVLFYNFTHVIKLNAESGLRFENLIPVQNSGPGFRDRIPRPTY